MKFNGRLITLDSTPAILSKTEIDVDFLVRVIEFYPV